MVVVRRWRFQQQDSATRWWRLFAAMALPCLRSTSIINELASARMNRTAVKGMNTKLMLEYIEQVIVPHKGEATQIMMDQLGVHKTAAVKQALEKAGLTVIYFPAKTSSSLSPCDNSFFHQMKSLYRDMEHNSAEEKEAAVEKAYRLVQPKNIVGYFRQCGLTLHNRNKKPNI